MSGVLLETAVTTLLIFAPFAFGSVELWALGIVQILCGAAFAAWAWGRWVETPRHGSATAGREGAVRLPPLFWGAVAGFVLLVLLQIVPLPPSAVRALSPGAHAVYARTLPGYAEGLSPDLARIPEWLVAEAGARLPAPLRQAAASAPLPPRPDLSSLPGPAVRPGAWRPLSLDPYQTTLRLTLLLSCLALFVAVTGHYRHRDRLARLLTAIVLAGAAVSLAGILHRLDGSEKLLWLREGVYLHPFGPFVNRNSFAAFAGLSFPVALALGMRQWERLRSGAMDALPALALFALSAVAIVGGIFMSLSRGGMITAVLSVAVFSLFLLRWGRHGADLVLLGAVGAAALAFLWWVGPDTVLDRMETLAQGQRTPSLELRLAAWRRTSGLIGEFPVLGAGLGSFRFAFLPFAPPGQDWWTTAHNEYLEVLCDTGIAGLGLAVLGLAVWGAWVVRPSLFAGAGSRYAFAGIVSGIAGILVHSAISSNMQVAANAVTLVVLGAALTAMVGRQDGRAAKGRAEPAPEPRLRRRERRRTRRRGEAA